MPAPSNLGSIAQKTEPHLMRNFTVKPQEQMSPSFALISVLALVSLAALTATAFLASARLERQASSSIGKTTLAEMALDSGKYCVGQVINDYCQADNGNTHIVTYWRTNRADELGYPFIAKVKTSGGNYGQRSAAWYYAPLFSPATPNGVMRLDTSDIQIAMRFTNSHQGTFSNDMRTYMTTATNGFSTNPGLTNRVCVQIPLLGGRTSPPVGWVYIDHEKRRLGSSVTTTSPAVRIAWFTEDLEGLIDAERMGAVTNRSTGTNSEEISLSSAKDSNNAIMVSSISTFTNNRKAYISYGALASSNFSGLNSSTNARYFASGLRSWMPTNPAFPTNGAVEWIPVGIPITNKGGVAQGYLNQGFTKINLNRMINRSDALTNIASVIDTNLPLFTNRAGGMGGSTYLNALAANIIDYADSDATPSTLGTAIGYDNYPLLTHLYDQFSYNNTNRTITHTTWMQFWNPSTKSVAGNVTMTFTNNDTVRYTNSATPSVVVTRPLVTNIVGSVAGVTTTTFTLPTLGPNVGFVTNFSRPPINLGDATKFPNFKTPVGDPVLHINTATASASTPLPCNNSFSYQWGTATITPAMTIKRQNDVLNSGVATFCAGFLAGNQYIAGTALAGTPLPLHDPRMTPYLGLGSANQYAQTRYDTTYWRGYVSQDNPPFGLADPTSWPDAGSTNVPTHGTLGSAFPLGPTTGLFTNSNPTTGLVDAAPFKISNGSSYTNICELGNVFDPIQWAPPTPTSTVDYSDCNIHTNSGSPWTKNNLYGGGSTLRIGRPEHSLFAFTNFANSGTPIPNMGQSAAALLDLFCITNLATGSPSGPYTLGAGRINLNTAPAPVLAALAGGIALSRDPNKAGVEVTKNMIDAFTNGVMKFRHLYPFLSPSQLLFISVNYGDANWTNSAVWSNAAVFSLNQGLAGITGLNDEGREEWFSKIYALSSCQSHNFRIYVVAQLVATNSSGQTNAIGPLVKKYYQVYFQNGSSVNSISQTNNYSATNNPWTWIPTGYAIDIYQSPY